MYELIDVRASPFNWLISVFRNFLSLLVDQNVIEVTGHKRSRTTAFIIKKIRHLCSSMQANVRDLAFSKNGIHRFIPSM